MESSKIEAEDSAEYRLRFFNFNMANNSDFSSLSKLQGPGGRGLFEEQMMEQFLDGGDVDVVFASLVETRLNVGEWVQNYLSRSRDKPCPDPLDTLTYQNARRQGKRHTKSRIRGWVEGAAAKYNGNLKSVLAYCSSKFDEDHEAQLFGRLAEAKVAGIAVPNPKKAFIGRTITDHRPGVAEGVRLAFVSAHFPITRLAAALEESDADHLTIAKLEMAKVLRKVLRRAVKSGLCNDHTVIFVQGDLNSRTVLDELEAKDVLLEVLADHQIQASIRHELDLPPGCFREIIDYEQLEHLPVTYKFQEQVPPAMMPEDGLQKVLTIGDVLQAEQVCSSPNLGKGGDSWYRRTLIGIGDAQRSGWGLAFKKHDFKAFRFPAAADRLVYWAPDALAARMSWSFPRQRYEVTHSQGGSDHRPVAVEALLRIAAPPPTRVSQCTLLPLTGSGSHMVAARTWDLDADFSPDKGIIDVSSDSSSDEGVQLPHRVPHRASTRSLVAAVPVDTAGLDDPPAVTFI